MESLQGSLVIASPDLNDPNFYRAVVLLIRHDEDGALGLVLNRASETTVKQLWSKLSDDPIENADVLRLGGPVQGPLMCLHTRDDLQEIEVRPGLFFSTERDKLEEIIRKNEQPSRFFVGYSGWGSGQLEHELKSGSWITVEARPEHAFAADSELWTTVTREIASTRVMSALNIRHVPSDPSLN